MGEKPTAINLGPQSRRTMLRSLLQLSGETMRQVAIFGQESGLISTSGVTRLQAATRLVGSESIQDATDAVVQGFVGPSLLTPQHVVREEETADPEQLLEENSLIEQGVAFEPNASAPEEEAWYPEKPLFDL